MTNRQLSTTNPQPLTTDNKLPTTDYRLPTKKIVVTGTRGIPNIQGGIETHCEGLYPLIAAKGFDVTVFRRKTYVRDNLTSYKGVTLYDIPNIRNKSLETIVHTFCAIWIAKWKLKADIIHIHAIGPAILTPLARLLGMKVVFTHHGPDYDRAKWGKIAKFVLRIGERTGCKFANNVIVISEVIDQIIKQKYKRRDARLIFNGVPSPVLIDDINYLRELGIESRKYIFTMGRFVPEKNFHTLIRACTNLKQTEYKLVIAGDADIEDSYSRELKTLAINNGVILTGFIKHQRLHTLLSHAGLFILPSTHEGLPLSLLEAMSYQLPVIISDIPANRQIDLPDDCYFQPDDENALSGVIDKRLTHSFFPITYDLEKYNWNTIAQQTTCIYQKLIKQ